MKRGLVLIGGGGHCKSVVDAIPLSVKEKYDEIVLTDPALPVDSLIAKIRVAGSDEALENLFKNGFRDAFITIGSIKDTKIRRQVRRKLQMIGFNLINIIDDRAVVSHSARLGKGIFIGKGAVVNVDSVIEDCAIINTNATVEHGCHVGAFTHVSVGAIMCGNVHAGADVFIGPGAVVAQGITVGDGGIIGAGAVVLVDVPAGCISVGVPAELIE